MNFILSDTTAPPSLRAKRGNPEANARRIIALTLAIFVASLSGEALACSYDQRPVQARVSRIKSDPEVRRVRGFFRFEVVRGETLNDPEYPGWLKNAIILGRVEKQNGLVYPTSHPAPDESNTCYIGSYFKPQSDARGVFYISRRKTSDRFELLHAESD